MRIASRRVRRREARGAAAVEFALVVPMLLVIIIAIADFGALFAQQISLTNIAREAARNAVVDGLSCAEIEADARDDAETVGMAAGVPVVNIAPCPASEPPCTDSTPGQDVTVTVTRPGLWLVPWPPLPLVGAGPAAPTLTARGVMRCEFS